MAQIAMVEVTEEWQNLAQLISEKLGSPFEFNSEKVYNIQTIYKLWICECTQCPTEDCGIVLNETNCVVYRPNGCNLWVKPLQPRYVGSCLNITEVE